MTVHSKLFSLLSLILFSIIIVKSQEIDSLSSFQSSIRIDSIPKNHAKKEFELKAGKYNLEVWQKDSLILPDSIMLDYDAKYTLVKDTLEVEASKKVIKPISNIEQKYGKDVLIISGSLKEVSRKNSPVPVEVYDKSFFKANPSPSIFEALQNINGVRPQVNCSVCNTGDIHINGLEGPYTMVTIDGMPIVSGLSSVYGLFGIPQSLIERVEIIKGPASTLYGSEAVGGLINVITKSPQNASKLSLDTYTTTWGEWNLDLASKVKMGKKVDLLVGTNYFLYDNPIDQNGDNFTDLTQQHRISVFTKANIKRKSGKAFSLASRYIYEDRWGGELQWDSSYRGGDELYVESIYTSRWEVFGNYELPTKEDFNLMYSINQHKQNSYYGDVFFLADQSIAFGQLVWNKKLLKKHALTSGFSFRYTNYDDNTTATSDESVGRNSPSEIYLPGFFLQDEIRFSRKHTLLAGLRTDLNSEHGVITSPRLNYKWSPNRKNTFRLSFGNGFRVVNLFTEDHAAVSGARELVILEDLKPETSWNGNLNFVRDFYFDWGSVNLDTSAFYTHFTNRILPDYEVDPNQIVYSNLDGYLVSRGFSMGINGEMNNGFSFILGATLQDIFEKENGTKRRPEFTENFMGTWNIGYKIPKLDIKIDYTGNLIGPMKLPLLSEQDPRPDMSPWWSKQNIQLSKSFTDGVELFAGVKNLLNWTPAKGVPFIIARAEDPFDKDLGNNNPNNLVFSPEYVYAPNQGIRAFVGFRYSLL